MSVPKRPQPDRLVRRDWFGRERPATPRVEWEWFGTPGHFIAASKCCFHLHTRIGCYRISTVGCYHPGDPGREHPPEQIGSGRLYETMVFELGLDGELEKWAEVDSDGYNDQSTAEHGHVAMCKKWAS